MQFRSMCFVAATLIVPVGAGSFGQGVEGYQFGTSDFKAEVNVDVPPDVAPGYESISIESLPTGFYFLKVGESTTTFVVRR